MEITEKKIYDIFNLSPYMHLSPNEVGNDAFDLLTFLYDVRNLPNYQAKDYAKETVDREERERLNDIIYTTKSIADNFLMVAPILLYRLVESSLKKYLLLLLEDSLEEFKDGNKTVREYIMTSNIDNIKKQYLESQARLDIEKLPSFEIIEEIRELNNALKHNHDYVSENLFKKNNYWELNKLITVDKIQKRVYYFDQGINSFFYSLVNSIKPFFS